MAATGAGASRGPNRRVTAVAAACAAIAGLALLARLLYGPGFVSNDPMWSLAWGEQIADGVPPAFEEPAASTPHPLPNLLSAALWALLGRDAEQALHALGFVFLGFAGHATFLLARNLLGTVAAVIAVALALTRPAFASFGTLAVSDIPFCALVLYAVAAGMRDPRAGVRVLGLLAIAGLIRPEAWFMSGLYWLWLWRADGRRTALRTLPLMVAAPVTWVLVDWAVTGDPLFSLTTTRSAATRYGRITGIDGLLTEGVHVLGYELRPAVMLVAAAGFAAGWRADRMRELLAVTAAVAFSTAIPVAAGTPLNGRYLLVVLALCCVAAAGAVTLPLRRRGARQVALAAAGAVVLVAGVPDLVGRVGDRKADLTSTGRSHADARRLARAGLACRPLAVTGLLLRPAVAVWSSTPIRDIADPLQGIPPRATFMIGDAGAARSFTAVDGDAPKVRAPAGARTIARSGGWTLRSSCR